MMRPSPADVTQRLIRIFALARPYRRRIAAGLVLLLISTAFSLIFPLGIGAVIDIAVTSGNEKLLHWFAAGVLVLFISRVGIGFTGMYLLNSTGERLVLDFRRLLFGRLHLLDLEFFHKQRLGDLASRLNSDTAVIRSAVTETFASLVNETFILVGSVSIMLVINWRLTLLILLLAPIAAVLSHKFGPALQNAAKQVQEETARSLAVAHESMACIAVVKALSRSKHESERYDRTLDRLQVAAISSVRVSTWFRALIGLLASLITVGIFWYGGTQVFEKLITAGELVAFLFYSQNITNSFSAFAQLYGNLNNAIGASSRVFEMMDMKPAITEKAVAFVPSSVRGQVKLEEVSFAYEVGRPVLKGINLVVEPGQIVALVGRSGSGKTTAMHLLPRLYDPSAGRVALDGRDVRDLPLGWLRDQISLVSQDVFLFGASIRENIRYGRLDATDQEVEEAACAAAAHEFITAFERGYETEVGERGVTLSGGQRQRLALARVFLRRAQVLILDEATSGLDSATEMRIQEAIYRENRRRGVTTIIVAHRLSTMRMANKVVVLDDGRIVEQGTHDELLAKRGKFYELIAGAQDRAEDEAEDIKIMEA